MTINVFKLSPGAHKLVYHPEHLTRIKNGYITAPIHLSVWPNNKCQLRCSYCCGKNVKEEDRQKELSLDEFKTAIDILGSYGLKAIEFSGIIGEPLLWKHFEEAVDYAYKKDIKMSLITNGLKLSEISNETLLKLEWIRVSLQSVSHAKQIDFDNISDYTRVSCSFIVANEEAISKIKELYIFALETDVIVRIAVARPSTKEFEELVGKEVNKFGDPLFFSVKEFGTPLGCYMPYVRAALDWNGNFLPCPSMQLNVESEGCIPKDFSLCHINGMEDWLINNRPHDLGYRCKFCNCGYESNNFIYNLLNGVEDVDFV
jgi:organic radical activating enzyme